MNKIIILFFLVFLVSDSISKADETSKTNLTYFGTYRGASVSHPGNSYQPALDGSLDTTNPQSIENLLTIGYNAKNNWLIGAAAHFNFFPVGNDGISGPDLQMLDPLLVISKTNLIQNGGFKLKGMLFVECGFDVFRLFKISLHYYRHHSDGFLKL